MKIVVGPSEMHAGNDSNVILISSSVGSGVAIAAYDPAANVAGILHFLLPSSLISPPKAKKNPFLFADTGIPAFLDALYKLGAQKDNTRAFAVGGSQIMDQETPYDIGNRNCLATEAILSENAVSLVHKEFGGNFYRTLKIEGTDIYIEIPGMGEKKL